MKSNETSIKSVLKDYLALRGIFSFPLTQGLGSFRGAPDRIIHLPGENGEAGRVVYVEIKTPTGKLSPYQETFQEQCLNDKIEYWVIRSLEELEEKIEAYTA